MATFSPAQPFEWARTYNNGIAPSFMEFGRGVFQNGEGGYLVIGNTRYPDSTGVILKSPFMIIQTDENGYEVSKNFYCDSVGGIYNILRTGRDTIAVYGGRSLLLLNESGDSLNAFRVPTPDSSGGTSIFEVLSDSSYIFVTGQSHDSTGATYIHAVSENGDMLWSREYHFYGEVEDGVWPYAIYRLDSGDYLVFGLTLRTYRYWMAKVNSSGDTLWFKPQPMYIFTLLEREPNRLICLGSDRVCLMDTSGSCFWGFPLDFGAAGYTNTAVAHILPAYDGNYIICGQTDYSGNHYGFIAKMDSSGSILWTKRADIDGRPDCLRWTSYTEDSNYVCAGYSSVCFESPCESLDVCLVKFTDEGDIIRETDIIKPLSFALSAHPNSFNSAVTITIDGSVGAHGRAPSRVEIFDVNGRFISEISDHGPVGAERARPARQKMSGDKITTGDAGVAPTIRQYIWQPSESIGSGVYLVRATVGDESVSKRIVYLK